MCHLCSCSTVETKLLLNSSKLVQFLNLMWRIMSCAVRTPTTPPVEHRQESIDQRSCSFCPHTVWDSIWRWCTSVGYCDGGMEIITRASVGARCEWVMAMRGGSKALTQGHLQAWISTDLVKWWKTAVCVRVCVWCEAKQQVLNLSLKCIPFCNDFSYWNGAKMLTDKPCSVMRWHSGALGSCTCSPHLLFQLPGTTFMLCQYATVWKTKTL